MKTRTFRIPLVLSLSAIALGACGGSNPQAGFAAALPPAPAVKAQADGAIFNVSTGYAGLHEGNRARRVGDALTILLVERTTTNKSTAGKTSKGGSASITPPSAGPLSADPNALNLASASSFNGGGNASQTNSLNGTIAVTIAEVRPNGTAMVVGEKYMDLSQGREWIQFSGIVRLADVDSDNTVLSSRIANARIAYGGKGAIAQASKPGWLSQFFNMISPF